MARLTSIGAELNTFTANIEVTLQPTGVMTLETANPHAGTYHYRMNPGVANSESVYYQYRAANTAEDTYHRLYFYITTTPTAAENILFLGTTGGISKVGIRLNTDRTLTLVNLEDAVDIGSSSAVSTGAWHYVELRCNCTTIASTTLTARLNGTQFATGTINLASGVARLYWGWNAGATGNMDFDSIAINSSAGSIQNSWPGEEELIRLNPNVGGDNEMWNGGGGTGTGFEEVDEIIPDDDTTSIAESIDDYISEYNIDDTPAAMASDDTIVCVQVGVRYGAATGATKTPFVLRIKASSVGTVEESATITPTGTGWHTNASASPRNYALTLYDLPGASTTAWTKADLDITQIGVRINGGVGGSTEVSTLWLMVGHKPTAAVPTVKQKLIGLFQAVATASNW